MSFGKRLAALRKSRDLTQGQMAQRVGVVPMQIHRYEADSSQPTLDVIRQMAKVLGVSSDELIFEPGDGPASTRIMDADLLQRFEKLTALPQPDREAVKLILDAVILKSRIQEITVETPPAERGTTPSDNAPVRPVRKERRRSAA